MEVFECMQCGAQLEIDSKGEMDGRCVICPYCRSEIVFRECRNRHTSLKKNETLPGGMEMVGVRMNNTRQDGYFRKVEIDELPGKVRVILMKIKDYGAEILTKAMREELYSAGVILFLNPDAVNPDRLDDLRCMGYSFYDSYPNTSISENLICQGQYLDRTMKRFTFTLYDRRGLPQRIFGTREILRQVGPLPKPDELIRFPNPKCAASIPNISKRCQWCGEEIRDGRGD